MEKEKKLQVFADPYKVLRDNYSVEELIEFIYSQVGGRETTAESLAESFPGLIAEALVQQLGLDYAMKELQRANEIITRKRELNKY